MKSFAKIIIVFTTISAAIMELIDTSIVNVALLNIAGNLGATIEDASWVITAYAIANVIIIPMTGFLAQYFGRKNYYLYSIVLFTLASILCGSSSSLWELVFWRFVQGIGGGALLSTSQSILFDSFEVKQRGMASAMFGIGIVMGPTLGPVVGGIIIDHYAWPLIFNINIPFGILAVTLTYFFVEDSVHHTTKPNIDWIGIMLLAAGVGSLQYVLERGDANDWFADRSIQIFGAITVLSVIGFIIWELNEDEPVVNVRLFKDPNLTLTTLLTFVSGFALFTSVFVYPQLLQRVLGYTPTMVGMSLMPSALASILVMPIVGKRLQAGDSPKIFITIGFILIMVYGWMLYRLTNMNASMDDFFLPLMVRTAGISMMAVTLTNQAVVGLSPRDIPQGVALNNMMRQLGGAFGIALMNTYISNRFAVHRTDLLTNITADSANFIERNTALLQGVGSKLAVTANAQQQAYQIMDLTVSKQAYLLTYADAFLFSTVAVLAVFPIIFGLRNKKMTAEEMKIASESAH
ncbi:MAG TPA: DHA2 family efflux MFS transporter permease subunit [Chitinophagales bacterium]|nr:DHA2 family efflux MFS transporter permease subunit [Chitinophagales bacterium]